MNIEETNNHVRSITDDIEEWPVIWITNDVEEWDVPDITNLKYKNKGKVCYIRDVDIFDNRVAQFEVGDYILENSNEISIKCARLWKIVYIFKPDKDHKDPNSCRRMLISEAWKKIEIESESLNNIKNS